MCGDRFARRNDVTRLVSSSGGGGGICIVRDMAAAAAAVVVVVVLLQAKAVCLVMEELRARTVPGCSLRPVSGRAESCGGQVSAGRLLVSDPASYR
jgi:hypothetical protein